jgi:hypothetical protein
MERCNGTFQSEDLQREHGERGHRHEDREDHGQQHDAALQRRFDLFAPQHQPDREHDGKHRQRREQPDPLEWNDQRAVPGCILPQSTT